MSRPHLELALQYAAPRAGLPARASVAAWLRAALARAARITVRFVGAAEARRLNRDYRRRDYATNVLTFAYGAARGGPLEGDIVLCAPVLKQEAKAQGKPLADHCAHLVVHGMLHLQGYQHDTVRAARAMEARERSVLGRLGVPDPYAERARG